MSWGEVKKINSDVSVPLNERMGYVNGLIKRGAVANTLSMTTLKYQQNVDAVNDIELLNVSGAGYVDGIDISSNSGADYYFQSGSSSIQITLIVDGVEFAVFSASSSVTATNLKKASSNVKITVDMNKTAADGTIHSMSVNTDESITFESNVPIVFARSLVVQCTHSGGQYIKTSSNSWYNSVAASISYALES